MLFTVILGAVGGYFSDQVEKVLDESIREKFSLSDRDMHIVGFSVALLIAALAATFLGVYPRIFPLVIGGLLGLFGTRLVAYGKAKSGSSGIKPDVGTPSATLSDVPEATEVPEPAPVAEATKPAPAAAAEPAKTTAKKAAPKPRAKKTTKSTGSTTKKTTAAKKKPE